MEKKSKKVRRTTRDNFYRPTNKKNYDSIYIFKRFINNFADKRDWGLDKKHFHFHEYISKKELVNSYIIADNPIYWNRNIINMADIERHLKQKEYIFYTNSPLSHTPLFCLDIDLHDWTSPNDIEKVRQFLLSLHPNCYSEKSSKGKGLHFYLLLDLSDFKMDTDDFNEKIRNYSNLLKLYINTFYSAKYDDVKATYTKYIYHTEYKKYLLDTCGTLCKLPQPETDVEFEKLYNIPFITIEQINSNARYICSILESIIFYSLNGGSGLSSCINMEYIFEFMEKKNLYAQRLIPPYIISPSYYYNSLSAQRVQKKKNNKNICEIRNNNNAFERAKEYYKVFFRQYYRTFNIIPNKEICRMEYRKDAGTDGETEISRKRLNKVYEYTLKGFDKDKVKESDYEFGEFLDNIEKSISAEQLDLLRKNCTKYRSRIYHYDIDIALGYIYKNLCNNNPGYEKLSLSVMGLEKWYQTIIQQEKAKGNPQRINGCNSHKRTALFILVQKLGYVVCLDEKYDWGKARKYLLTEKFLKYWEFIRAVGQETIDAVQKTHAPICAVPEQNAA